MITYNKRLVVVSLITLIGSLGYGIVLPILFSYSQKYGLSYIELGILFSTYSIFEFISTPFIGIFSDKFGRRIILIISQFGTFVSFLLIAFAPSAIFLFIARSLDGITAGNIPVAQAVISDTTEGKARVKGFGILGACYGIGLVVGPIISFLTLKISSNFPYIFAALLSLTSILLTILLLDETNRHLGVSRNRKLFDFNKIGNFLHDRFTGSTLFIYFLWAFAFGVFIYAYQTYVLNILHLSASYISLSFVLFGIISAITQVFIISPLVKALGNINALSINLLLLMSSFIILAINNNIFFLIISVILMAFSSTSAQTVIQSLLSIETPEERQGEIMGLGASSVSIGQIIGPMTAGVFASYGTSYLFLISGVSIFLGFLLARYLKAFPSLKIV